MTKSQRISILNGYCKDCGHNRLIQRPNKLVCARCKFENVKIIKGKEDE